MASPGEVQATLVWNMLSDGQGGIDWAGLPYACAHYGVQDVQGLMDRLIVIKAWRKPEERGPAAEV